VSDHPAPSNRKWKLALVAVLVAAPLLGVLGGAWAAQTFPDVPPSNTFYKEIQWGAANNIINGYTNGKFVSRFRILAQFRGLQSWGWRLGRCRWGTSSRGLRGVGGC
jgi:hypothetical protein